jgi:secreted Zn-dependent insulinase-like peptidase
MQEGLQQHYQVPYKVIPLPSILDDGIPQNLPFKLPQPNPFVPDPDTEELEADPLARHAVRVPPSLLTANAQLRVWHLQATFVSSAADVRVLSLMHG